MHDPDKNRQRGAASAQASCRGGKECYWAQKCIYQSQKKERNQSLQSSRHTGLWAALVNVKCNTQYSRGGRAQTDTQTEFYVIFSCFALAYAFYLSTCTESLQWMELFEQCCLGGSRLYRSESPGETSELETYIQELRYQKQ